MRIAIKLGGSILEDAAIRGRLLRQIAELASAGHEILLVHGGGKSLNRRLGQLGMESRFLEGLRVTDAATLEVAVMVLAGEVNKRVVAEMNALGVGALGMCGADAAAVRCEPVEGTPGYPAGIGFVGRATRVNAPLFDLLLGAGYVPVLSSIGFGAGAGLYNVNADQMASACAAGTGCRSLVYLTDVAGVKDERGEVIARLTGDEILALRRRGVLSGGMLPKTSSCLDALEAGVAGVYILPGDSPGILTRFAAGTLTEGTEIHGNA